jgi:hypothetical protein
MFVPLSSKCVAKHVPQHMRRDAFVQPRPARAQTDGILETGIQHVMPPAQTRPQVLHQLPRREKPLPFP